MNHQEILWTVVSQIHELSQIAPKDSQIKIEPSHTNIESRIFQPMIQKLYRDDKVIKLVSRYTTSVNALLDPYLNTKSFYNENGTLNHSDFSERDSDGYELKLLPEFNNFYKKLKKEFTKTEQIQKQIDPENIIYKIDFNDHTRELKINNILLCKPDFDKNGHKLISYLFQHQNEKLKTATVINDAGLDSTREINGIISDLGFTGNLKKLFFNSSKQSIQFINPITQKMLDKSNIKSLSLKDFKKQK